MRVNRTELADVLALAAVETEGNTSFMVRKLLAEALAARANAATPRRKGAPTP